jgi:hypothetical protein
MVEVSAVVCVVLTSVCSGWPLTSKVSNWPIVSNPPLKLL